MRELSSRVPRNVAGWSSPVRDDGVRGGLGNAWLSWRRTSGQCADERRLHSRYGRVGSERQRAAHLAPARPAAALGAGVVALSLGRRRGSEHDRNIPEGGMR